MIDFDTALKGPAHGTAVKREAVLTRIVTKCVGDQQDTLRGRFQFADDGMTYGLGFEGFAMAAIPEAASGRIRVMWLAVVECSALVGWGAMEEMGAGYEAKDDDWYD